MVVHEPHANSAKERIKPTLVTRVGRTLVTTNDGCVFDTTQDPPRTKGECPSHRYLYTEEEFETECFKDDTMRTLRRLQDIGHHPSLDELLYVAIALKLEIPAHLQERAYALHQEITATLPTPSELASAGGEPERPLPSTGAKVRAKVRA